MKGSGKDSLKPPGAKRLAAGLGGGRPGRGWTSAARRQINHDRKHHGQESGRWHDARREGRFPRFATRRFSSTTQESGFERGRFLAIAPDLVQAVGCAWTCGDAPEGEARSCGAFRTRLRVRERAGGAVSSAWTGTWAASSARSDPAALPARRGACPRREGWLRGCRAWHSPAPGRPARWPRCTA